LISVGLVPTSRQGADFCSLYLLIVERTVLVIKINALLSLDFYFRYGIMITR